MSWTTTADAHTSTASSRVVEAPVDLNGLVSFPERRNLVSARVPSHFNWPLLYLPALTTPPSNVLVQYKIFRTSASSNRSHLRPWNLQPPTCSAAVFARGPSKTFQTFFVLSTVSSVPLLFGRSGIRFSAGQKDFYLCQNTWEPTSPLFSGYKG